MSNKFNEKTPIEQVQKQAEKAMGDYLELAKSDTTHSLERPDLMYYMVALLDYDMDNIYNYMNTAAEVLAALADPEVSRPLFEKIKLPHSEALSKMLERLIYCMHELNGSEPSKAAIEFELKFNLGAHEGNRLQFELIIADYTCRLERLKAINPILEKINQTQP